MDVLSFAGAYLYAANRFLGYDAAYDYYVGYLRTETVQPYQELVFIHNRVDAAERVFHFARRVTFLVFNVRLVLYGDRLSRRTAVRVFYVPAYMDGLLSVGLRQVY